MRALLRRELRRLAPYGLSLAALCAATFAVAARVGENNLPASAVLLAACALLGVTTVAPDRASGAAAFLVRLPLGPGRALGLKLLAAGLWAALAGTVSLAVVLLIDGGARPGLWGAFLVEMGLAGLLALGAGALTSGMVHRTIAALLVTPVLLLGVTIVAVAIPTVAWRVPSPPQSAFALVAAGLAGLLCLALTFPAYGRGDPHRPSARPALIGLGGLVPGLLLGLGATASAHAWTVERAPATLSVAARAGCSRSPDGARLAVPLQGWLWTGHEQRLAIVRADRPGAAWLVPVRGVAEPVFSPDGRWLLLRNVADPGGWLVDLEAEQLRPLPGRAPEGFGFGVATWRAGGRPLLVRQAGAELEVYDPLTDELLRRSLPAGGTLIGARGEGEVVVSDPEGVHALPLEPRGRPRLLWTWEAAWPYRDRPHLSPTGRYLLVEDLGRAALLDLESARMMQLGELAGGAGRLAERTAFGPGDAALLVQRSDGLALVDLRGGGGRILPLAPRRFDQRHATWAADGARLVLPGAVLVDVPTATGWALPLPGGEGGLPPVAAFLSDEEVLLDGSPLEAFELGTGAPRGPLSLAEGGAR